MKFTQFDRYSRYLKAAALLIAFLTYWTFRDLELSGVYSYVAQGDVLRSALMSGLVSTRSVIWDFFGLLDRFFTPHTVTLLRAAGLVLTVLDLYLLAKLLDYILGQKFWGFLAMFLGALSPFAIVASVSGSPAAAAAALVLLFLMSLYRNQYMYAGLLAGVCYAANLPGLIMFLIALLDLLQNFQDRKKMVSKILSTTAAFMGVLALVYLYSLYTGSARLFSIPVGERDLSWSLVGVLPLVVANLLNVVGIGYLIAKRRYDVYRTHFHTLMMWITSCAMCIIQPSTLNLLSALIVSIVLAVFFLQGFSSLWTFRLISAETFLFFFVTVFLFGDLYANNAFLKDSVLDGTYQRTEAVSDVMRSVARTRTDALLASNFVPAELSVKLGRQVIAVDEGLSALDRFGEPGSAIIYVAKRSSRVDTLSSGCRIILNTSFSEMGKTYFVQVAECGENK